MGLLWRPTYLWLVCPWAMRGISQKYLGHAATEAATSKQPWVVGTGMSPSLFVPATPLLEWVVWCTKGDRLTDRQTSYVVGCMVV